MNSERICQNCKTILPPGSIYCPRCGERVSEAGTTDRKTIAIVQPAISVYLAGGTVLQGKYRINHVIGQGGFGITYDGTDLKLQMHIAIKEYFPGQIANRSTSVSNVVTSTSTTTALFEQGLQNFLKEAQNMAKFVGQPNFVSVHDYFVENNTAYIVMEYVEGRNLHSYMQQCGPLSMEAAMKIITPVMDALEKIHSREMIHRDISPTNIMVLPDGRIKLLDFGAVRDISWETQTLTAMSAVYKKGYSPIEQQTTDLSQGTYSDVYALCATLYEMLTASVPPSPFARLSGNEALTPPSAMGVQLLPSQEEGLLRGLAVYPKDRLQTIAELRKALLPSASDGPDKKPSRKGSRAHNKSENFRISAILVCIAAVLLVILGFELAGLFATRGGTGTGAAVPEREASTAAAQQKDDADSLAQEANESDTDTQAQLAQTADQEATAPASDEETAPDTAEEEEAVFYDYPADALSYGGHHYYIYDDDGFSWDDAMEKCLEKGGYMAVINDADENEALYQYIEEKGCEQAFFGLRYRDGEWKYFAGDTSDFTDWGINSKGRQQPNNADEGLFDTSLDIHMQNGHWSDNGFGRHTYTSDGHRYGNIYTYICEWDG